MNVGFLICIYAGDNPEFLGDMFQSMRGLIIPKDVNVRIYLHIDGDISRELDDIVRNNEVYKVIKSEKNIGLARGLNKLIEHLEDENYLFRMDADDLVYNNRLIKQLHFMEANKDIDISGGGITEFNGHPNNVMSTRLYPVKDPQNFMSKSSPFAHVSICFRRSFFNKYGSYPTNFPLNEDIAYWFNVFKLGASGANINDILVNVRMDDAYGRRSVKKSIGEFKVFMKIAIWKQGGYIYPFLRLIFRLIPTPLVKIIYNSKLRSKLLNR